MTGPRLAALPEPDETDGRIRLRLWRDADLPLLMTYSDDPELAHWTTVTEPITLEAARAVVPGCRTLLASGEAAVVAIVDAADDSLLGSMALVIDGERPDTGEISYWVGAPWRRRGVATRAVNLLTTWSFEHAGLDQIELLTDVDNVPSQRVAERCAFSRERVLPAHRVIGGRTADMVLYARRTPVVSGAGDAALSGPDARPRMRS